MLQDYTHTGSPTIPDLRPEYSDAAQRDIIDAPLFLPLGYHFVAHGVRTNNPTPTPAHMVRPGAFR